MAYDWHKPYQELKKYIENNPKIAIEKNAVFIPQDVRGDFYSHFDKVRDTFLKQHFSHEVTMAEELKGEFIKLEKQVTSSLNIAGEVKMAPPLRRFLNDPVDGLMRPLFNPLFDLLKDKIDEGTFEENCLADIRAFLKKHLRTGYERWAVLCLLKWLEPTKMLTLPLKDFDLYSSSGEGDIQYERVEVLPGTSALKELLFDYSTHVSFAVPDIIVYSSKLNKYTAVKTGFIEPRWKARFVSEYREWLPLNQLTQVFTPNNPWPSILVYIDDHVENIKLTADRYQFCQPDMIVNTLPEDDWFNPEETKRLKAHTELIKPLMGNLIVCRGNVPEEASRLLAGENTTEENASEPGNLEDEGQTGLDQAQPETGVYHAGNASLDSTQKEPADKTKTAKGMMKIISAGYDYSIFTSAIEKLVLPEDNSQPQ